MRRRVATALALAFAALAAPAHAFDLEQLPGTYVQPVQVAGPPGDTARVLVVEQSGRVQLVKDGVRQAAPFLDVASRIDFGGEEGLLSMAFAPDYATSGFFYVAFTADTGTSGNDFVVEQHRVAPGGDTALAGSAREVIRIPHRVGDNHNAGQLHFGPDGNLWISTGDGGGFSKDSDGDAQDPNELLGKVLRIAPRADGGYDVPAGNPFAGGGGAPEVWATGLRNPWRFSFDRATGDLLIGDVGEATMEEVDLAAAPGRAPGANFGWPYYEGTFVPASGPQPATHHAPLFTHTRAQGWRAITGGYVIRDPALAEAGKYVYGDFFVDRLWLYDFATGTRAPTDDTVDMLSGFGEDGVGRVYATSLGGSVYRLVAEGGATPPQTPPGETAPPGDGTPPAEGGGGGTADT
ncbi:MAG TPA: PQQ-dependent sugar dehydrogenase, partial [Solirubrobacteraceae bacterium]|nr:PQQ-dependent sugar dehydrogenase [Solirubrobacteraceae bacterium]